MNGSASASLRYDKLHPLRHRPGNRSYVAGEAAQPGDHYRDFCFAGLTQGGGRHRPSVQRIATLACFYLYMLGHPLMPFGFGKAGDGGERRFDAQAGLPWLACRYPDVADTLAHETVVQSLCTNTLR